MIVHVDTVQEWTLYGSQFKSTLYDSVECYYRVNTSDRIVLMCSRPRLVDLVNQYWIGATYTKNRLPEWSMDHGKPHYIIHLQTLASAHDGHCYGSQKLSDLLAAHRNRCSITA